MTAQVLVAAIWSATVVTAGRRRMDADVAAALFVGLAFGFRVALAVAMAVQP
jgi:hypothetical protein